MYQEGGRGLAGIEDSIDTSIKRLEDNTKKSKEKLITEKPETTQTTQGSTEQR